MPPPEHGDLLALVLHVGVERHLRKLRKHLMPLVRVDRPMDHEFHGFPPDLGVERSVAIRKVLAHVSQRETLYRMRVRVSIVDWGHHQEVGQPPAARRGTMTPVARTLSRRCRYRPVQKPTRPRCY